MMKMYMKIALRHIRKQKGYAFLNIAGLAIGMACSVLVYLYVHYERSYDDFHVNADRLYRITSDFSGSGDFKIHQLGTPRILERTIRDHYPQVEMVVQLSRIFDSVVKSGNAEFKEPRMFASETSLFETFTFPFLHGEARKALDDPLSVVVTRSTAVKYFGRENVLDEILTMRIYDVEYRFRVTGISEDVPLNSHFRFDLVISREVFEWGKDMKWGYNSYTTYLLLREGISEEEMEARLAEIDEKYRREGQKNRRPWTWSLTPIRNIHLHSDLPTGVEPNGNAVIVSLFTVVAGLILFIACINYVNLSTARSVQRAREVGMRKVLGSQQRQLVRQFLGESVFFALIALIGAAILVQLGLPFVRSLTGRPLVMPYGSQPLLVPELIALAVLIGLIAGFYPAFLLSSHRPIAILKSTSFSVSGGGSRALRNGLVVLQFAVSILLIIGTLVIQQQMTYIRNRRLGFDKDHILVIRNAEVLGKQVEAFKEDLRHRSGIVGVTSAYYLLGNRFSNWGIRIEGQQIPDLNMSLDLNYCDPHFLSTLGMEMAEGRFFSEEMPTDSAAMVINEEAVRYFGLENPVGKRIDTWDKEYTVIGIVKNVHYESLHTDVKRMAFILRDRPPLYVLVKIRSENVPSTINVVKYAWNAFSDLPFEFSFLDEQIDSLYRSEIVTGRIVAVFSSLAIVVSCLGLFGLAAFAAEQKTKEIGIRKVFGASVPGIVVHLAREFTKWVVLANGIAWPLAYFMMTRWLQGFAYRIDMGIWPFVLSGGLALAVALLTVSYQSVKAALSNPVEALRYE